MIIPNIWKNKNVPNHQPEINEDKDRIENNIAIDCWGPEPFGQTK